MWAYKLTKSWQFGALLGIALGIAILAWPHAAFSTLEGTPRVTAESSSARSLGDADGFDASKLSSKTRSQARIIEVGMRQFDIVMATRALQAIPPSDQHDAISFALNEIDRGGCFESDLNGDDSVSVESKIERPLRFIRVAFETLQALPESHYETKARWGSFLALERTKLGGNGDPSIIELADFSLTHAEKIRLASKQPPSLFLAIWTWISNLVLPAALGGLGVVTSKLFTTAADEVAKAYVKARFVAKSKEQVKGEKVDLSDDA